MDTVIADLMARSLLVRDVEDVHALCSAICQSYGFERFLYGARLPNSFTKPMVMVISGYPVEWRDRYVQQGYVRIDPAVRHCTESIRPLGWHEIEREDDENVARFLGEAAEHGLVSGITLPQHGLQGAAAMLSFSTSAASPSVVDHIAAHLPHLHLLATYVHDAACRVALDDSLHGKSYGLTEREKECLLWSAEGKTSWEAAQILGVSERTVIFHLRNATEKLGVANRQQAIARAIAQGVIAPQLT